MEAAGVLDRDEDIIGRLDSRLRRTLEGRNIYSLHPVQKNVFLPIYGGENVLVCAPTGIGKTEAAILPILQRMIETGRVSGISCIYITPLRALNRDMLVRLKELASSVGINVAVRHGDTPQSERNRQSDNPPDILITTPETVQILLVGKKLRKALQTVRFVVVDELHELVGGERGAQLSVALERLSNIAGEFQRIGLSATIGSPDEVAKLLAYQRAVRIAAIPVEKEREIEVRCPVPDNTTPELSANLQVDEGMASALQATKKIIEGNRSTLFFVNTRDLAEAISSRYHIWLPDFPLGVHHGSLSKDLRIEMEEQFKSGVLKCLVCTSSLELGIDIGTADFTIQFNSPRQVTRLLQRIGRAGHRATAVSMGCIVAYDEDEILEGAVISRRALSEQLEEQKVREKPLTVLANQIIAMSSEGSYSREDMFSTVRRSYPFRKLSPAEFSEVYNFLSEHRLIKMKMEQVQRSARGLHYFYENISMIRDEKTYNVRDISTRKIIGTLDEGFVISFAEQGSAFITHGRSWRVVELRETELLVEPISVFGALPSWIGEEIPVPFDVAQEVGRLRAERNFSDYPIDEAAKEKVDRYLSSVTGQQLLATDRRIVIEFDGYTKAVINACFGSRVNETLARMIAAVISARSGESVGIDLDPYRIVLDLPRSARREWVAEALRSVPPEALYSFLRKVVSNISYSKWQFLFVAKKFGIIRKDADYREMNVSKLMQSFEGTPLMEETLEKTIWETMDIERTEKVLKMIADGEIEIAYAPLSPIGKKGIDSTRELYKPSRADRSILMALKKRLIEEEFTMLCFNCEARWKTKAGREGRLIKCWKCGSRMVAALSDYELEKVPRRLRSSRKLTDEQIREIRKLRKNANLVMEYGQKALIVLAGRGIGPDSAARILSRMAASEDDLLKDIMEQEIQFARTKRFWD
jgi:ATP-dependent Lhr-like helicase